MSDPFTQNLAASGGIALLGALLQPGGGEGLIPLKGVDPGAEFQTNKRNVVGIANAIRRSIGEPNTPLPTVGRLPSFAGGGMASPVGVIQSDPGLADPSLVTPKPFQIDPFQTAGVGHSGTNPSSQPGGEIADHDDGTLSSNTAQAQLMRRAPAPTSAAPEIAAGSIQRRPLGRDLLSPAVQPPMLNAPTTPQTPSGLNQALSAIDLLLGSMRGPQPALA